MDMGWFLMKVRVLFLYDVVLFRGAMLRKGRKNEAQQIV